MTEAPCTRSSPYWTQAREGLKVTTIIFANHSYQILKVEFGNMGFGTPGPQAMGLIDIDRPRIDWVAMGKSMGCPAVRVDNAGDFYQEMVDSAKESGPRLIEVSLLRGDYMRTEFEVIRRG